MLSINQFASEAFDAMNLPKTARFYVAFSGGVDSTVLLHLMARLREQVGFDLTALHVDHNLQQNSVCWREHCESICEQLSVPLHYTTLYLDTDTEAAARSARYQWMSEQILAGSVLMTAHHQQDRAETLLFNLLRGSGSAGLSSLRAQRPFYSSKLVRPLLAYSQLDVLDYAKRHKLVWIEDPSNKDTRYARNDIRKNILPVLSSHRTDAIRNISRAAANLERENSLMREVAIADLVEIREHPKHPLDQSYALCTDDVVFLSPARQANLIRFWLHSLELHTPSQRFLEQILAAIATPPSATAVLQEEGIQFRFYKGFMYVMPATSNKPVFEAIDWRNPDQPLALFADRLQVGAKPKLRELLGSQKTASLRFAAREHVQQPQALQGHSLNLKKWMQEIGVPPWRRQNLPILTMVKANQSVVLAPVDQNHHNDWISLHCAV